MQFYCVPSYPQNADVTVISKYIYIMTMTNVLLNINTYSDSVKYSL